MTDDSTCFTAAQTELRFSPQLESHQFVWQTEHHSIRYTGHGKYPSLRVVGSENSDGFYYAHFDRLEKLEKLKYFWHSAQISFRFLHDYHCNHLCTNSLPTEWLRSSAIYHPCLISSAQLHFVTRWQHLHLSRATFKVNSSCLNFIKTCIKVSCGTNSTVKTSSLHP